MNWKKFWNNSVDSNTNDVIKQVQRKDLKSTLLTVNHIIRNLDIKSTDLVLDVCCGNGILTQQVAKKCESIIGIDQSENLLKVAMQDFNEMNISYVNCSALELSRDMDGRLFDKIYLQFSFQYFDKRNDGHKVIEEMLKCLKSNGRIFIGDITDYDKTNTFYNTILKKTFYYKGRLQGKNPMGKFWKSSEIDAICNKLGVNGKFLKQPNELPYSSYRFDYLIEN